MVDAKFTMEAGREYACLRVKGHAGAGAPGNDIVCASASILAYTLAQNLKMLASQGGTRYEPHIKLKEGDAVISCRAKTDSYPEMLHTFLVIQAGYQILAHNYPDYVTVETFGTEV